MQSAVWTIIGGFGAATLVATGMVFAFDGTPPVGEPDATAGGDGVMSGDPGMGDAESRRGGQQASADPSGAQSGGAPADGNASYVLGRNASDEGRDRQAEAGGGAPDDGMEAQGDPEAGGNGGGNGGGGGDGGTEGSSEPEAESGDEDPDAGLLPENTGGTDSTEDALTEPVESAEDAVTEPVESAEDAVTEPVESTDDGLTGSTEELEDDTTLDDTQDDPILEDTSLI